MSSHGFNCPQTSFQGCLKFDGVMAGTVALSVCVRLGTRGPLVFQIDLIKNSKDGKEKSQEDYRDLVKNKSWP